jgi:hypothetical protein
MVGGHELFYTRLFVGKTASVKEGLLLPHLFAFALVLP